MKRVVVFGLLLACSNDGGGTPSDGIADTVEKYCAKAFECMATFPGTPAAFTTAYGTSTTTCVTQAGAPAALQDAIDASVTAGRITYAADNAVACNAFLASLQCDDSAMGFWGPYALPTACDHVFDGTVKLGDTCTLWTNDGSTVELDVGDCAAPNECSPDTSTCVPPV
ncbi:MAG: hypothetical protein NT062_03910 [Proteobacteria bacterium]|nr:hypothetical protein [Pseudomonadota bacterium]